MVLQIGNWGSNHELTVSPWGKIPFSCHASAFPFCNILL